MKIKKLEILGFKSFVDKASLTFPAGITAIVGPNGSGKSNIVDAIKWALGEQSAKTLRGRSMEDVIFNGSVEKKPLGMAEVTVTFRNVGGRLPQQFGKYSEVSVRRRIFRSGESEYYLNKTPCRLRDINELLMGTGAGSKAYSIIAQGQIGSVITARPQDRRYLIEEAAGITKYKSRRQEASRKMEATQQNLLRIGDIVGEVKRQMNSLSQQAKRAETFKHIKDELKEYEMTDAARRYISMTDSLEQKKALLADALEEESRGASTLSGLEESLESLKFTSLENEEEFQAIQKQFFSNETEIKTLEESIRHITDRIEAARIQNERYETEIRDLEQLIEETNEKKHAVLLRIDKARTDEKTGTHNLEALTEQIEAARDRAQTLREEWDGVRSDQVTFSSKVSRIKNAISDAEKWIRTYTIEYERKQTQLETLREEHESLTKDIASREGEREKVSSSIEKTDAVVKRLTETLASLRETEAALGKKRDEVHRNKTELSLKKDAIAEMIASYEGAGEGVRQIMSGNREGIVGILADFIDSDEDLERAVSGFLGNTLSAVMIQKISDISQHIKKIKSSDSGRVLFIPVNSLNGADPDTVLTEPGVIGRLADHVTISDQRKDTILSLIGNTHLVSDLDTAMTIWQERRPGFSLVTLDGEVITPQGLVSGGAERVGVGLLQNKREMERVARGFDDAEETLTVLEEDIERLREQKLSQEASLTEHKDVLSDLKIRASELDRECAAAHRELDRTQRAETSLAEDITRHAAETEQYAGELEAYRTELLETEQQETGLADRTNAVKQSLSIAEEELKNLEEREMDLKLAVHKATDLAAHLTETVEEYDRQTARADQTIADKTSAVADGHVEIENLHARKSDAEQNLHAHISSTKSLENKLSDARATMESSIAHQRELEEKRKETSRILTQARERVQEIQTELNEQTREQDHLTTRIEERYHIDLSRRATEMAARDISNEDLASEIQRLTDRIGRFGEVNLMALSEFNALTERHEFLLTQERDLVESLESLKKTIRKIDRKSKERFTATFDAINTQFAYVFSRLVPNGKAQLLLTDEGDPLESGVEMMAQPPGKKLSGITLLSGGEKALTAIALIFAIFLVNPSPFCFLDEVDAPLDDINIERFIELLKEISQTSQIILITHNKKTMELADSLYGVTMEEAGISKMISVKLTQKET
ncbi:MAG: chromosome segregation protein SMC [Deltaproteobacteria bacterium]|nr:chromosome segregation protein SMC [Candidatus Zymogenaceae bacterium]